MVSGSGQGCAVWYAAVLLGATVALQGVGYRCPPLLSRNGKRRRYHQRPASQFLGFNQRLAEVTSSFEPRQGAGNGERRGLRGKPCMTGRERYLEVPPTGVVLGLGSSQVPGVIRTQPPRLDNPDGCGGGRGGGGSIEPTWAYPIPSRLPHTTIQSRPMASAVKIPSSNPQARRRHGHTRPGNKTA
ncbi:hypothetical protein B0T18DRAFT_69221 [Schizothecium vesticola]|uniref:Uncharacterized protein n=1 Tax=Schizothecium vesticola TaxID=314040 RepID=A0AA40F584_9PEZI|nr:hypothetical protein B0T18DRAFT_69221 [Schizothecium vesticola]